MATYNGKVLKQILRAKNIQVKDFLAEMGWKNYSQMVSFMEGNPTATNLAKVASILGVSVAIFFDEAGGCVKIEQTQNNNFGYAETQSGDKITNYVVQHEEGDKKEQLPSADVSMGLKAALEDHINTLKQDNQYLREEVALLRKQLMVK